MTGAQGIIEKNAAPAYEWIRKAADCDYHPAQHVLGSLYLNLPGFPKIVEENETPAYEWIRKAAEGGHPPALSVLGMLYADGIGVERDIGQSIYWYQKAAEQGDEESAAKAKKLSALQETARPSPEVEELKEKISNVEFAIQLLRENPDHFTEDVRKLCEGREEACQEWLRLSKSKSEYIALLLESDGFNGLAI